MPLRVATSVRVVRAIAASRSLRRVLPAFLLFNAAVYGTWIAILVYAYDATGAASVGVVALAQLLPAGLLAPVAAVLGDRFPRERVLLAGYLLQAGAFAATAAGMFLGAPPVLVYAAGAVLAVATTITRPAQGALLPSLSRTPEELTAANSAAGTAEGLGVLLGPLASALVLTVGSPAAVWAAGAVAAVVAAALVAGVRVAAPERLLVAPPAPVDHGTHDGHGEPRGAGEPHAQGHPGVHAGAHAPAVDPEPTVAESALALMAGGFRAVALRGHTRLVVTLLGMRMLSSGAIDVLFVLLAIEVFGTGDAGAGVLTGALGLGLVLGGAMSLLLVGRQRLAPALGISALAWGIPLVVVAVAPVVAVPVLIAVAGVGFAAIDVIGRTLLQRVTPARELARVLGALEGVGLVFLAAGSLLAPALAAAVGADAALIVVALLLPATVMAAWLPLRHMDSHGSVPVRAMAILGRNAIFAPLAPHQLEALARRARWMTLAPGEVLIRQGDIGDRYCILESGALDVAVDGRHVRSLGETGEGVGEIALLRGVRRTATVTGSAPSVLLVLERADFLLAVTGHDLAGQVEEAAAGHVMPAPEPLDPGTPAGG